LYLPGGGFVFPASSFHYKVLNEMAGQLHARGMMVNYRLAPEYPFPAGLEDAVAAYRYLVEEQGVPPNEIVIAGDSAGGGLSLSLLLSIREQGLPMPLCACVFSPFTDISFSSPSMKYNRWLDPMLPTGERMSSLEIYVGDTPVDHPLVSPVHASYEGFPPILAQVSSTETLLDDTLRAARNARAQDAKFEVEVWHGMPHVFQIIPYLPESRRALRHAVEFIKKQMPYNKTRRAA
jgi:acetyl esterase/lipase